MKGRTPAGVRPFVMPGASGAGGEAVRLVLPQRGLGTQRVLDGAGVVGAELEGTARVQHGADVGLRAAAVCLLYTSDAADE